MNGDAVSSREPWEDWRSGVGSGRDADRASVRDRVGARQNRSLRPAAAHGSVGAPVGTRPRRPRTDSSRPANAQRLPVHPASSFINGPRRSPVVRHTNQYERRYLSVHLSCTLSYISLFNAPESADVEGSHVVVIRFDREPPRVSSVSDRRSPLRPRRRRSMPPSRPSWSSRPSRKRCRGSG